MKEILKIAIISDLHCMYRDSKTVSYNTHLYSNANKFPVARHPIYSLVDMLKNKDINADYLLCPGDITNTADSQGLISGWNFLKEVKVQLKSKDLLATIGNHDVDSRKKYSKDPHQNLRALDSDFPVPNDLQDKFWSNNYVFYEKDDVLILLYNSCYNHNSPENSAESIILQSTLDKIEADLKSIGNKKYKIAMCHHHPMKHSNPDIEYKDGDVIENGDKLLKLLDNNNFQLLIHGHKHDPAIKLQNSLHIFASGSFSSLMNITALGADNCFHIIDFYANTRKGTIKTWVYAPTKGWVTKKDTYFPCNTGFGSDFKVEHIAKKCQEVFQTKKLDTISYKELKEEIEDLCFLRPDQQTELNDVLKNIYQIYTIPDLPNEPTILIKDINE